MIELYWHKYREIIMYLIVGVLTTLISLVIYYGLSYTILNPNNSLELQVANIVSWFVAVLFAYVANRRYVFNSKEKNKIVELFKFVCSRVITLILDMLIMYIFVSVLKYNDKVFKIISQIFIIVLNYVLGKVVVFRKKCEE